MYDREISVYGRAGNIGVYFPGDLAAAPPKTIRYCPRGGKTVLLPFTEEAKKALGEFLKAVVPKELE